jgi:cytidyltransferase-like protein
MMSEKTIMVSGGFDPLHIGHLRMIKEAAQHGKVIVVVNSDAWLLRKKGFIFMPFEERKEIIEGYTEVDRVEAVDDSDGTVCEALWRLKPTYFANGGDRTSNNTPEMRVCEQLGIEMLWSVGGGKIQSSSEMVANATTKRNKQ